VPAARAKSSSQACGKGARTRVSDLAHRLGEFGIRVKERDNPRLLLYEWSCRSCGSSLETNIYPEGMEPLRDVQLGVEIVLPETAQAV
jgi:hypothetical protein